VTAAARDVRSALLVLLAGACVAWGSWRTEPKSTIVVVSERAISEAVRKDPVPPAFRLGPSGLPVVSPAGLVQVVEDGALVYDAFRLPGLISWAKESGRFDTVNWCEVESLCAVERVAQFWRAQHPEAPRLGIGEVTAANGGFPDFDGKGVSGHLTHQVGVNVNVLYMGRTRPEKEVLIGQRNEDVYDLALERALIELFFEAGANAVTMTARSRFLERVEGVEEAAGKWGLEQKAEDGQEIWVSDAGTWFKQRTIILRKDPKDHGDHANVQFSFLW